MPTLEQAVGVVAVVQRLIVDDQMAGVDSMAVQHAGKVNSTLDVLKGVLARLSAKKLFVVISHAEIEK